MQLLRRFTVNVISPNFTKHRDYDVLAVKEIDDETYFLVADNYKNFTWVPATWCKLDFLHDV